MILHLLPIKSVYKINLLLIFTVLFSNVKGQGWTFNFQLAYSGNCTGATNITLPQLPQNAFQTQAQCESVRQQILAISASGGGCTVYYKCTPCTGSDIVNPGQSNPGEVSFDSKYEGKPFFVPHQSKAFEEWATNYKQQLESYGIKSILGQSITPNTNLPQSENIKVNKLYGEGAGNFNPKGVVKSNSSTQPKTENGKDEYGIIDPNSLTSAAMIKKRDEWYEKNGFNNVKEITNNQITEDSQSSGLSGGAEKLKSAIDELPFTPLQSKLKGWMEGLPGSVFETVQGAIDGNIDPSKEDLAAHALKVNTTNFVKEEVKGAVEGGIISGATGLLKAGGAKVIGKLYGKNGVADYETGIELGEKGIDLYKKYNTYVPR